MKMFKIIFLALLLGSVCYGQDHGHAHEEESHKGHEHKNEEKSHEGHKHKDEKESHKGHEHEDEEESHKGHDQLDEEESHQGHGHEEESHDDHEHEEKGHDDEGHSGHDDHEEGGGGHAGHGGHEGHGSSKAIGKGKAIEEVDETKGFRMSEEAKETIGVKLRKPSESPLVIPKDALVVSLDKRGIYRYRDGFFKMLPVKIEGEDKNTFTVAVNGLRDGDEIAVEGVGLLRVTDIYSTDTSEYGHGH